MRTLLLPGTAEVPRPGGSGAKSKGGGSGLAVLPGGRTLDLECSGSVVPGTGSPWMLGVLVSGTRLLPTADRHSGTAQRQDGTTRFIAGTSWQWGTEEEFVQTDTWQRPVNLTPYGSEIREPTATRFEPDTLVLFDPILFTGKPRDFESGLDFFGARYYSNQWCRWLGTDQPFLDNSVNLPQNWNLFRYCANNPINIIDPNGMLQEDKTGLPQFVPTEVITESHITQISPEGHLLVVNWESEKGIMYTDDWTPIEAMDVRKRTAC
jgi:RHS repeat-associated protein